MAKTKANGFDPVRTKELQEDWRGLGATSAYYGLVVLFIFVVSLLYHTFMG